MIKMGIYGILRVLVAMQSDLLVTGIVILIISLISGVWGVMMAIMQHDLKRLLAYTHRKCWDHRSWHRTWGDRAGAE